MRSCASCSSPAKGPSAGRSSRPPVGRHRGAGGAAIGDIGQQLGAHQVHVRDGQHQRMGHVGLARDDAPARMAQCGQGQQAERGRLLAQRARRPVRARRDAPRRQPVLQRKAQSPAQERRQHRDLRRLDPLAHQAGDLVDHPLQHLRIEAMRSKIDGRVQISLRLLLRLRPVRFQRTFCIRLGFQSQPGARSPKPHLLRPHAPAAHLRRPRGGSRSRPQAAAKRTAQRVHRRRHREGAAERDPLLAGRLQAIRADGVRAQETAVTRAGVVDDLRRCAVRQPLEQDVVADRRVLLDVVRDDVAVVAQQVRAALRQRPQPRGEQLVLQREIQQIVGQAVVAETGGAFLRLRVDPGLAALAGPCGGQPRADLGVGEPDQRGFVQIVQDPGCRGGCGPRRSRRNSPRPTGDRPRGP